MSHKRDDQYIVRFPDGLRDRVRQMAKANRRSMNSEIILAIEARVEAATGGGDQTKAPVAAVRTGALPGSNPITQG